MKHKPQALQAMCGTYATAKYLKNQGVSLKAALLLATRGSK